MNRYCGDRCIIYTITPLVKATLLFFITGQSLSGHSLAQLPNFQYSEIAQYQHRHHQHQTWLEMGYASAHIQNPQAWLSDPRKRKVKEVEIVFTRYPIDKKAWITPYDSLLVWRVRAIQELIPETRDTSVHWKVVLQTAGKTDAAARKLPHGAVVHYRLLPTDKMREGMRVVNRILSGNLDDLDTAVVSVLNRNTWKNAVIVNDWTGSMYPYGAQAVLWQQLHLSDSAIRFFVFFNDGDHKPDEEKQPGQIGGLYPVNARNIKDVLATMREVMLNGHGGDIEENDVEAILFAIEKYGDQVDHVVLLADNNGGVKDRALIPKISRPVKVVLCGMNKGDAVHPDYIEIARATGGSLHTISEDINDLAQKREGEEFSILDRKYKVIGGKIVPIE